MIKVFIIVSLIWISAFESRRYSMLLVDYLSKMKLALHHHALRLGLVKKICATFPTNRMIDQNQSLIAFFDHSCFPTLSLAPRDVYLPDRSFFFRIQSNNAPSYFGSELLINLVWYKFRLSFLGSFQ